MRKPIKIKIDVSKIDKRHLFKGKNGTYLNCVAWENDRPSEYGDTHRIQQDIPKEAREAGDKPPYIGNMTMPEDEAPQRPTARQQQPSRAHRPPADPNLDAQPDEIPFAILFPILLPALASIQSFV